MLTMVTSLIPSTLVTTAFAADVSGITDEVEFDTSGVATINRDGKYTLTGAQGAKVIKITDNADVTLLLKGAELTSSTSPIQVTSGASLTIIVADDTDNNLGCTATTADDTNNGMTAGIYVPDGATLTIDTPTNGKGNGKLTVTGGYGGAGIGGKAGVGTIAGQTAASGNVGQTTYWVDENVAHDNRTDVKPKGGAAGAGGEQGNAAEIAGAINILNGVVSATGGTGGAGIGGGMGAAGAAGNAGSAGENSDSKKMNVSVGIAQYSATSSWDGDWGGAGGGAGGNGGTGGVGGAAGNIRITGGTVSAVAGDRAAAIGGGAGGPGGAPGEGANGGYDKYRYENYGYINPSDKALFHKRPTTTYDKAGNDAAGIWTNWELWGDAKVGRFTYSANAANDYLNWLYVSGLGGDGGRGADGQNGRGGAGGNGGNITISGGTVTTNGSVKIGGGLNGADDTTSRKESTAGNPGDMPPQVGNQQLYRDGDRNYKNWAYGGAFKGGRNMWMLVADGWHGGAGGKAAAQEAEQADGAKANITIDGAADLDASIWSDIVDSNGQLNAGVNRPKNTAGDDLYLYTLTVTGLDNRTPISGATVTVRDVTGTNGSYTFTAKTGTDGKAQLWLPVGTYELVDKDVYHNTEGWITSVKPFNFKVDARDNQAGSVSIGSNFTLTASTESKVYFSGEEKPVTLTVDTSAIAHEILSVEWFAEKITGNSNIYDKEADQANGVGRFDDGYKQSGDKNHGSVTVTKGQNKFEIPINENGRYWVQVKYESAEGSSLAALVCNGIVVDNIYRKYPIQVNSYTLEKGVHVGETGYKALKTAGGEVYKADYGFAWDLNGYDANALNGSKLLAEDVAAYDTVPLAPQTTLAPWYLAHLLGNSEEFVKNTDASGSGYQAITMTLNPSFLSATENTRCDTVDGKKDFSKYTIVYAPRDGALTAVTVSGVDADATDGSTLYSNPRSYTEAITFDTMVAQPVKGYKLTGAKIVLADGTEKTVTPTKQTDGSYAIQLTDIHGTAANQYKDKVTEVRFIYKNNMTDVTIKALYKDTTTPVEGFTSYTTPMEVGTKVTYTAPVIDNHINDGSSLADDGTYTVVENGTITFYYYKQTGNVTYKAVLDGTDEVLWQGDGTVKKGNAPATDVLPTDAAFTAKYERKPGDVAKITDSDDKKVDTYNGIGSLTVTYTYQHKTRNVVARLYDITKRDTVLETATAVKCNVGEYATINAPTLPTGYSYFGDSSKIVKVKEGTDNQYVDFYCEASDNAVITVRLYDSAANRDADTDGSKAFQTLTFPAAYGVATEVKAPTTTGWELDTAASDNDATKSVTPVKGGAAPVVKFVYKPVYDTITVKLTNEDGSADLPTDALPAGWTGSFQVQQGQKFTIAAPSIVNYKLANGEALEKSLSAEQIKKNKTITFKYTKAEADLITITVKGVVDGVAMPLYSYTKDVHMSATDVEVQIFTLNGYKLDSVKMNGNDVNKTTGDAYKIDPNGNPQTVTATYSGNMADVTINAYYAGGTKPVEGFTAFTVKAEIGKPYSYGALTIPGYDNADLATPSLANVTGTKDHIDYHFTKQTGNVIYKLVDANDENNVLATSSETVNKDDAIDNSLAKAPTATNWKLADGQTEGKVDGAVNGEFDGVHAVTVTYKAVAKTKDVTIVRYDVDTNQTIPFTADETAASKDTATLTTGTLHTLQKSAYRPADYNISGNDKVEVYVEDDAETRTVNMYFRRSTDEDVTVVLYYNEGSTEHEIQRYVVQRKPGTTIKVTAPDMAYKGYTRTEESKDVGPTDNEVKFKYTVQYNTVEIELKDEHGTKLTTPNGYDLSRKVRKGEGIVLTAPSITGYTLMSTLVVSRDAAALETEAGRKVTFTYQNTAAASYVIHTIILQNKDTGKEITRYNSTVAKGNGETTYYAPVQVGFQVDKDQKKLSNNKNDEVTFNYTQSAATITIKFVDKTGKALATQTEQTLTGYEKGQTVMVAAPAVPNYALAGLWSNNSLQSMNGVTTTIKLSDTATNNEVTFAYENRGKVYFVLKDAATDTDIQTINGVVNENYGTATGGKLDLTTSGWAFQADNNHNSPPFTSAGQSVTVATGKTENYTLYYTRMTRNVTYKYVDVTNGGNEAITFTDPAENPKTANVGENLTVPTPQIPGYTPTKLSKTTFVTADSTGAVEVTFEYIKKETGSVTVKHILKGTDKVITSYTASGSVGEWFTATKLATDTNGITADGRYKFTESDSNKATQTVKVTAAEQTITFEYEPNYVTVNTYTSVDGAETEYQTGIEVVKTTGTQKLYAPSKTGYVLKGITVKKNVVINEDGSATTFPDYWNNNELTLTNLTSDVKVVYFYEKINDNIKDYQATITVKDQYETYELGGRTETVIKDVDAKIASKAYDGYVLIAYQIGDSADQKQWVEADKANNFKLTHKFDKDTTVTFFYGRADGSAVVPGGDMNFGTGDDVIIKPKDDNKPSVNQDGSVKVPNGAEVVTPNGTVIPPNGSIVKPDGTIIAPDGNDKTDPGIKIDPSNPDNAAPTYLYVKYMANGGKGEIPTQFFKKGDTVTIAANNFTADNKTADGWNTQEDGKGVDYAAGAKQLDKSLTLFAKWTANNYAESVTITFHANLTGVQDEQQTIGFFNGTSATENLRANTFVLNGWTFGGWSKQKVGSIDFANKAAFTFKHGDDATLSLYAQWYKQDGSSITVPGKDGDPSNADTNVTGAGNGIDRDPTTGVITIPAGGTITVKDPTTDKTETITLPNGGKLNPDGSYSINLPNNGGTIDVDKDGKEEVKGDDGNTTPNAEVVKLTYEINNGENDVVVIKAIKGQETTAIANPFTYANHEFLNWMANINGTVEEIVAGTGTFTPQDDVTLYAQWAKKNAGDGSIELPGKDGILEGKDPITGTDHAKDNVTVTPDQGGKVTPQPDGTVKVEDKDATVTRPDPSDPNYPNGDTKEEIKVPAGSVIYPDGTIKLPEPKPNGTIIKPGDKIDDNNNQTGYFVVTFLKGEAENGDPNKMLVKAGNITLPAANTFTAPSGKIFTGWKTGDVIKQAGDAYEVTANVTFTAQFKKIQTGKAVVTFDFNGGTAGGKTYETRTGDPGATLGTLPNPTRGGYTFNGWNEQINENTLFGEENSTTTYTAQWTAKTYTIHYNGNGATGNVADQTYVFNTANAKLAQNSFTLADKVFLGWSVNKDATSAMFREGEEIGDALRAILTNLDKNSESELTLYAIWKDNQVTPSEAIAIFDFAGGKDANGNTSVRKTGAADAAITITAPTREGYTFTGWDKGEPKFGKTGTVTVFTAQWTATQYTVTFQSGANGTMQGDASVKVDYNSSIEAGKVPTITAKTGYVFIGWENNGNVYTNEAVASFKVTGNVTFTARYENISKAIAIFDYNGGKDADGKNSITMTGIAGEEITVKAPTREGYTFAGWDKTDLKYGVAGSVTVFTAQWTANKHEVTFVVGDDTKGEMTGEASVQVDHNGSVEANKVPTITAKTGYVFIGWSDGTSTYAADAIKNYKVTADVTFTAQYEADSKAVVIFDFNGGKDADNKNSISMSGDANAAIDNMAEPSRDGYTFAGWKDGEQDVTDLVFGAAGTVTVYTAQWTVNKHTVTFNAGNNGSMNGNASVEVDHNGSVAAEKVPTITANEGFVFVGWSDGNSTYAAEAIKNYKVTAEVTFTAQYEEVASKAFAIFDYAGGKDNDGKSSVMMTGTAGAAITIAAPTRAGYTFAGWKNGETTSQNPTFGAAGSVTTYTAAWTADPDKTFKVNFVVDATKGDVTGTTEFDVASGKFLTEVPTVNGKDGYTFIGWSDGKNTYYTSGVKLCAITGNTTFTAQFTKVDPVNPDPSKKTLTITSNSDTVLPGKQVQFKALLNGTETNDVTWTVKGGTTDTTISESGVLTVGSTEANGTKLTITATSKTDTGLTAEKTIIVTAMPVKKPDGSVVIPGGDGKIDPDNNKKDDITIKPNPKPDGGDGGATVNPDGTVTLPDGGTVVRPNPDGNGKDETIKVPGGSTVDPDGAIHFMYTVTHKYSNGTVIRTENVKVKEGESHTFQADNISGYTADPSSVTVKGGDRNYNIVITYNKNTSGGGSTGGGGSSGGGSSSGGSGSGSSTKPSQPDTKPTPGTKPNDPTQTGIANWLRTDKHTTSMTGYGNGLFGPEDKVTRAQVAQIFYRLLKDNNVKITVNFTDVPDDAWYATAVNTLGSLGIVGGIGDGRFDPNRPITRAEFCVIATRFAKVVSTVENPFSDINAQDWYYTAVTTAASYDWVTGMGDGTFRPYDVITRAQAATIINRMLGAAADRAFVDKYVPNPYKDVSTTHWAYYQIIEASVAHDHGYDAEGVEIWNSLK